MRSILSLLMICVTACATSPIAADNLRVATFNINWGNVNLPDIARAIREADADLICIQESNAKSEQFLKQKFHKAFPHIVFAGYQGKYAAERFGFLSTLPLSDLKYIPPTHGLFGSYLATVWYGEFRISVINVHLSPFVVPRGANFGQAWQAVSAVEAVHQNEIRMVGTHVVPECPTLVCGDLNSLSTFAAPLHLSSLGLIDSFAAVTEAADTHPTWRWPLGRLHIQFRIDYIFHSTHFRTVSSRTISTTGSDHLLVVSEVVLKDSDSNR